MLCLQGALKLLLSPAHAPQPLGSKPMALAWGARQEPNYWTTHLITLKYFQEFRDYVPCLSPIISGSPVAFERISAEMRCKASLSPFLPALHPVPLFLPPSVFPIFLVLLWLLCAAEPKVALFMCVTPAGTIKNGLLNETVSLAKRLSGFACINSFCLQPSHIIDSVIISNLKLRKQRHREKVNLLPPKCIINK